MPSSWKKSARVEPLPQSTKVIFSECRRRGGMGGRRPKSLLDRSGLTESVGKFSKFCTSSFRCALLAPPCWAFLGSSIFTACPTDRKPWDFMVWTRKDALLSSSQLCACHGKTRRARHASRSRSDLHSARSQKSGGKNTAARPFPGHCNNSNNRHQVESMARKIRGLTQESTSRSKTGHAGLASELFG